MPHWWKYRTLTINDSPPRSHWITQGIHSIYDITTEYSTSLEEAKKLKKDLPEQ